MKTLDLSMAAVIVGTLGASFAACSAQSTGSPPREGSGATTSTPTGGTGNTAGSTVIAGGNTTSSGGTVAQSSGGTTSTSTGGTFSTGVAGTSTAAAGTSATSTGGSTGATMGCGTLQPAAGDAKCCVATGTATDLAIDDLEDGDNTILPLGNRQGYWYTYADATATETPNNKTGMPFPPTAGGHACSLTPAPPACAGKTGGVLFSAGVTGSLMPATSTTPTYAGMGFDFNNHFAKSCPYGGTAYKGITFWAKGTGAFKMAVKIPTTTQMTSDSGTCAAMCEDHYAFAVKPMPDGTTWSQFTVTFSDAATFSQAGWGTVAAFTPGSLIGVQFQVDGATTATAAAAFNFSIDDVAFM